MQPRHLARPQHIHTLLVPFFVLSILVPCWAAASPAPRALPLALRAPINPAFKMNQRFLSANAQGEQMVDLFLEGDISPAVLRARGVEVNTVVGGFATARCPLGRVADLLAVPGIRRMHLAERCKPNLDLSAVDVSVTSLRTIVPPDISGIAGQGILVGDVDTGIDWSNPDFKNPDGTTRIVAIWDQTQVGTSPPGFSYGSYWTQAQINAGTSTELDTEGHGSQVMGILAGDGSSTGNGKPAFTYVGMAPKADICMVKTDFSTPHIVDGVNFIFQRAAALGKKAVVNLSLGTEDGPHDGTYPFDTMISALTGPGKIVVASAGNAEGDGIHGQLTLSTTPQNMTLSVPNYARTPGAGNDYMILSTWYEGSDQIAITITTPRGTVVGPVPAFSDLTDIDTQDGYINILNGTPGTFNGDNEIYIEISDQFITRSPRQGTWTFTFTPTSIASTGRVDMYLFGNLLGDGLSLVPFVQGLAVGGVIGSPASADSVICVGAHTTKACWTAIDGNGYCWNPQPPLNVIASFSSNGPLRDGRIKPDLTAPGFGVASTKSANITPAPSTALIVDDGAHIMSPGTSFSSPHVSGAVALLLSQSQWANAGPTAIRARLKQTARIDAFTGAVPNNAFGYGKLNISGAIGSLMQLAIPHPAKGQFIPPGKPDSVQVTLSGPTMADSVVLDLSINGGGTYGIRLGVLTSVITGSPTSLSFFPDVSMITTQGKVRATTYRTGFTTATSFSDSLFLIQAPTAVEVVSSTPAQRFELGPNSPNPFNPMTAISFGVATPGHVTLRIFNAEGKLVRTLVDKPMPAGSFRARWDGKNQAGRAVASGVYLYELSSSGSQLTRKMSLLK